MSGRLSARVVLARLIDYVELAGREVTDELLFQLTAIVREGVESDCEDLFAWSLERLNGRLRDARLEPPLAMPPITRGSIGYGHRQ